MGSFFTYDINLKIKKFDVPPCLSEKKTIDFDQKHNRNQKMYQNLPLTLLVDVIYEQSS